MKRTRLTDRSLPDYTPAEERMNTLTHAMGVPLGITAALLCVLHAIQKQSTCSIVSSAVYGGSMTVLYAVSAVYHGLPRSTAKKVMQVIDHCVIYLLIAGTYTPIALSALRPAYPAIGWGLFFFEWTLTALAVTLTAIDWQKYHTFSMICYVGMGWAVLPFMGQALEVLTLPGFLLLLFGGISYTIGAVLYGIGGKRRWFHAVFHIFVLLGSLLQFLSVLLYAL